MRLKNFLIVLSVLMIAVNVFAATVVPAQQATQDQKKTTESAAKADLNQQYQQIIDEYKQYLATIAPAVNDEIKTYRTENAKLNNQKRDLYKKLSNQAQESLKKQRDFRKKLPFHINKTLNDELNK